VNNDSTYNGWTNRETWACNLWITNDQGLCELALERLEDSKNRYPDDDTDSPHHAAALKDWWEDLTDPDEELMSAKDILAIVRDIGDEDEINWSEIAESLLAD
jgi:hypothetical protein